MLLPCSVDRRRAWLATGVAALAAAVALDRTRGLVLWQDEVATARIVTTPGWTRALRVVADGESTPPLYYALVWLLHRAGVAVVDLRLLSVIAAALAAGATVLVAGRVTGTPVALASGLLVAVGWQPVSHGAELRAYALTLLVTCVFALSLLRTLELPTRGNRLALGVIVVLGSLTHYFFLLSLASVCLLPLVGAEVRARVRPVATPIGLGLIPFLAWTPALLAQDRHRRFAWVGAFRARDVVAVFADQQLPPLPGATGWIVALTSLGLVAGGAVLLARRSWQGGVIAALAVGPATLAALLWAAGEPIFLARNLIGIAPFAAIALCTSVAALVRRPAAIAVAVPALALCAVPTCLVLERGHRTPPFDRVALTLDREGWTSGDPILVVGNVYAYLFPLSWYLPGRPDLIATRSSPSTCAEVFVVVAGAHVPPALAPVEEKRVTGSRIRIARVIWAPRDAPVLGRLHARSIGDPPARAGVQRVLVGRRSAGCPER